MLDIGVATRPYPGFIENGDRYYFAEQGRKKIVSVIDGLGHGYEAARSAEAALDCMHRCSETSTEAAYKMCHEILIGTRGVVIGVSVIDTDIDVIEFTGVGNIDASVYINGVSNALISSAGILGSGRLATLHTRKSAFPPGAILIMHSDGVSSKFRLNEYIGIVNQPAQFIADVLLRDWGRTNDDATVVVVRREDRNGD